MKIQTMPLGDLQTNCYIIINEETNQAVIIDPGAEPGKITDFINKNNLKIEAIFLTHGHADHLGALEKMREYTGAEVYVHEGDVPMLANAAHNLSSFIGKEKVCKPAEHLVQDGDFINIAGLQFYVSHTPGHTKGGCCYQVGEHLFVGDTIFCESIGRTDLPGGSYKQIISSINEKILTLPPETKIYPGHGPSTDVAWERKMNPFLK